MQYIETESTLLAVASVNKQAYLFLKPFVFKYALINGGNLKRKRLAIWRRIL
jgi:hypothetical protein